MDEVENESKDAVARLLDHTTDALRYISFGFLTKESNYLAAKRLIADGGIWEKIATLDIPGPGHEDEFIHEWVRAREFRLSHEAKGLRVTFHPAEGDWCGCYLTAEGFSPVCAGEVQRAQETVRVFEEELEAKRKNRPDTIQWRRAVPFEVPTNITNKE